MLRRAFGLIIILLLAVLAISVALQTRNALQRNHALYLMNQGKWKEASAVVGRLTARTPGDPRSSALLARIALNTGAYAEAATLLREMKATPEGSFSLAVCSYETDREGEAAELFRSSLAGKNTLEPSTRLLAQMAVDVLESSKTVAPPESSTVFGQKMEAMLWHSLAGRALYASGAYEQAASEIEEAIQAGDMNGRVRLLGCAANAIEGNYPSAQRLADRAREKFSFAALDQFLAQTHDQTTSLSISMDAAERLAGLSGRIRRAHAWSLTRAAVQESTTAPLYMAIEALQPETSSSIDVRATMLRGDAFEQLGEYRSAYLCYADVLAHQPAYSAFIRMRDLAGDSPPLKDLQAEFLTDRSVVCYVPAESIESSQTLLRKDYRAFLTQADAISALTLPENSEYYINLVARGDPAFGLWPEVSISIDGQMCGILYINREGWDCFWLRRRLEKGVHQFRIEYINNSERLRSEEEDRNFYLQSIIISKAVAE